MKEKIIATVESKHLNDPTKMNDLDSIVELLSQNLEESIQVINELGENEISWISVFFEDISWKFRSPKFIEGIEGLIEKYSKLKMLQQDIDKAREALE